MFVCELDRPWLETPFLFQGFELKSDEDILEVQRHCKFVYIDLLRTRVMHMKVDTLPPGSKPEPKIPLGQEMKEADNARKQTSTLVRSFIDDIRFGNSIDVQLAKEAVSGCVASILRNPDAMMFMTQMREKDQVIGQHAFNSCIYAILLGRLAGLKAKELEDLGTCGLLHDVGKIALPQYLLKKEARLTQEEWDIIRQHTSKGRDILISGRNIFSGTVDVAYGHHENIDGSGYPRGLQGHQLNQSCKIVAIVEKYDAFTSDRPYRPAFCHLDAIGLLNKMAKQNQLDAELTSSFVTYLGIYPPGTIVELSTKEVGIVLEVNLQHRLRPQILVVRDPELNPVAHLVDMALKPTDDRGQPYKIRAVRKASDYDIDLSHYENAIMHAFA